MQPHWRITGNSIIKMASVGNEPSGSVLPKQLGGGPHGLGKAIT